MKKVLILCLLLVFVAGCVPLENKPLDVVDRAGFGLSDALESLKGKLSSNEYLLTPASKVRVDGKLVELKDLAFDYKMIFSIDGQDYLIKETNREEIVNGLSITVTKVSFDPENKDTYAITKIAKYVPGENEYLMYIDNMVTIDGKNVKLYKFLDDKSIYLSVDNTDERIKEGETKVIKDLKITNVKTNLRAITSEKYSILKIEV